VCVCVCVCVCVGAVTAADNSYPRCGSVCGDRMKEQQQDEKEEESFIH
jgi:hypothetical protein